VPEVVAALRGGAGDVPEVGAAKMLTAKLGSEGAGAAGLWQHPKEGRESLCLL
jgi:hypothetical protein